MLPDNNYCLIHLARHCPAPHNRQPCNQRVTAHDLREIRKRGPAAGRQSLAFGSWWGWRQCVALLVTPWPVKGPGREKVTVWRRAGPIKQCQAAPGRQRAGKRDHTEDHLETRLCRPRPTTWQAAMGVWQALTTMSIARHTRFSLMTRVVWPKWSVSQTAAWERTVVGRLLCSVLTRCCSEPVGSYWWS